MSYSGEQARHGGQMQRVTVTLDDQLIAELDQLTAARGYHSRSEAMRDVARAGIQQALLESNSAPDCVAALVYVYDHSARDLALRLAELFHEHHDLAVATMHIHLNHESGMEVAMLKGPTRDVQGLADRVLTERGVRHGRMVIVPAEMDHGEHRHGGANAPAHTHIRTR
jgi:CopG family nickel-responsive transcriptional regulator